MSIELNPREVLDVLRSLGYEGITKDQLKLFMKDLKKLIKHDRRKYSEQTKIDRSTSPLRFAAEKTRDTSSQPPRDEFDEVTTSVRERYQRLMNDINRMAPSPSTKKDNPPPVTDPDKILDMMCTSCGGQIPRSPSSKDGASEESESSKCCCCCRHGCSKDPVPSEKKKEPPLPKPASFIRSTKSANDRGGCGKSDPVTLYQYYQDLWSRQNLPGENPRSDLRWRVRHKMMGPRVSAGQCLGIRIDYEGSSVEDCDACDCEGKPSVD